MFFIVWGTKHERYEIKGIQLDVPVCPTCNKTTKVNFYFNAEAFTLFWIPGRWSIESVEMLCLNCGNTYEAGGALLKEALLLFKKSMKGKKMPKIDDLLEKAENEK